MNTSFEIILNSLEKAFPGKQIVSVSEISTIFSQERKTTYNQLHADSFPVKAFRINGRPKWRLIDVARCLSELEKTEGA